MNLRTALILALLGAPTPLFVGLASAQILGTNAPVDENPKPTWETQKQARTFQLGIPAPGARSPIGMATPLPRTA